MAQRIVFYGGSFDPPHATHRALIEAALQALQPDALLVVPTGNASSYKSRALTPATHRLRLCELAFADLPKVHISHAEALSSSPHYTIETLERLEAQSAQPIDWYLLVGGDQLAAIHTWRRWQDLLAKVTLVLAPRAGSDAKTEARTNAQSGHQSGHNTALLRSLGAHPLQLPLVPSALSSTKVRQSLAQGSAADRTALQSLLAPEVLRYIAQHSLYPSEPFMATTPKTPKTPKKSALHADQDILALQKAIVTGLEDIKAADIQVFDTEHLSSLFERVMIASGNSNRQTRALAMSVLEKVKEAGFPKPRIEGEENGEWIIVDCGMAVCHIMQPLIRSYYHLEDIWGEKPVKPAQAARKKIATGSTKPAAKKAPAKKAPAKKAAGKTLASSAPAGKALAKKAAAKKPAAKKAAPSKAPAKKTAATKTPVKAPAKTASKTATKAAAKKAPAKKA